MSSTNNQGKRRCSETTDEVEPKTEMFKSLKARVFSLKQKDPLSMENQVISNKWKNFDEIPEEKKFVFFHSGQNEKLDSANSNFSFDNEERLDNLA
ncbi:unnamed protein product [Brachionus calyciflorus]|uniref:Uncharacterized protein n=1 Tax=Brachionus calyciflorus TaxID=104777 RepID=A0A814RH21_9BILA|nr:unnamed protein product [Brachionus calyciflorus]